MAKKDKKSKDAKDAKKARMAKKNEKNVKKADSKLKKLSKKAGDDLEDDVDLDELLKQLANSQLEFEEIHIDIVKKPTKRLNSTLVSSNNNGKKELVLFGGEVSNGQTVNFFNDLYVYTVDNNIWRRYISKNSPLARSSHAMCYHPSGIFLMHGGEFSSPKQSTFHHYSDTWILDSTNKEWSKIDNKKGPSSRSGHRMTVWKNYILLHGGFRDLGTSTTYLDDLWLFDITTYKWEQVGFPPTHSIPDARSGHSFIPTDEGAIIYGGYCKVKAGRGLQKGKILTDCWELIMKSDTKQIRWERKRKQGFQPSPRVGCSMQYHKGRGLLFGGVYDYEETEETLDSEFYNTLMSYNIETNRWYTLSLRSAKLKKIANKKEKINRDKELEDMLNSILAKANLNDDEIDEESEAAAFAEKEKRLNKADGDDDDDDDNDNDNANDSAAPAYEIVSQMPHPRFNAVTCVLDDTLYIYGGMFEHGEQEFNLDSFYAVDLSKLQGVKVFWEDLSELENMKDSDDEFDDDDEDDDEDDDDDEDGPTDRKLVAEDDDEEEEDEQEEVEPEIPDPRPYLPHPKAFETLRAFYIRTGAEFLSWAISQNKDARGKVLKSYAFDLCEERWWERRDQVRIEEDALEESGVTDVIEKDFSKSTKRR
ncbi:hypothetical protein B5S28_g1840 [[Candida] boidinii]|nr:hypothetical protein B5S28_g1840 [[Candida] boidinii]OWB64365.1 hypothetical protein B5S29_g5449 [[Candida] boidinii]OWB78874.1 hypothetical protein B5S32_g3078 [[Candida] boidinii]